MDEKQAGKKTLSLRNEKLKANRASETEEQSKVRLTIRCENIEQEGEPKNYNRKIKRLSETEDHEKQCLSYSQNIEER